ncbi:plasmid recombination protein [Desulfosporosinus fructosivorans]|uniref:plasmid recombination protein n=1 Tax=Desulfosporosinus fructosivorans TaxID=2018669 RepID=UPI003B8482F6
MKRHNERKNQGYSNSDIVKNRSHLNVHFKTCEGSYVEAFDKMIKPEPSARAACKRTQRSLTSLFLM